MVSLRDSRNTTTSLRKSCCSFFKYLRNWSYQAEPLEACMTVTGWSSVSALFCDQAGHLGRVIKHPHRPKPQIGRKAAIRQCLLEAALTVWAVADFHRFVSISPEADFMAVIIEGLRKGSPWTRTQYCKWFVFPLYLSISMSIWPIVCLEGRFYFLSILT